MTSSTTLRTLLGPIGFGGAPLGNMFRPVTEGQAEETLRAAWDAGIRYFDTAPVYGTGLSEHRFGNALRGRQRDEFVLSSKVGRILRPNPASDGNFGPFLSGLPFDVEYDYSADGARRSIEDSLQRLGMARIDIVYIHDIAEDVHGSGWKSLFDSAMKGAARTLADMKAEGVIKAWGLGVNTVEACERALEQAEPDVFLLAGRYSLLNTPALDTLFPACEARGVEVVVGSPYNSGLIAGGTTYEYRQASTHEVAARDKLASLAGEYGVDLRAAALQFCEAHPVVASVIPGTANPGRVSENMVLLRQAIPHAFWQALKDGGLIPAHAPVPAGAQ